MKNSFPSSIIVAAQSAQRQWLVPACVTLAQWADESAYGAHMPPGSNNPFGIKAAAGQPFVACPTHEVLHGRTIAITANFRKFKSIEDAFDLHGQLLHNAKPYQHAMTLVRDPDAFANALTGVYATDPRYGQKLIAIMGANNLYRYDVLPLAA